MSISEIRNKFPIYVASVINMFMFIKMYQSLMRTGTFKVFNLTANFNFEQQSD